MERYFEPIVLAAHLGVFLLMLMLIAILLFRNLAHDQHRHRVVKANALRNQKGVALVEGAILLALLGVLGIGLLGLAGDEERDNQYKYRFVPRLLDQFCRAAELANKPSEFGVMQLRWSTAERCCVRTLPDAPFDFGCEQ